MAFGEVFDLQNRLLLPYQSCYGRRAGGLLWPLLSVLLVAALVGSASGQSQPPDVTGTCQDSGGGIWQLRASGPGLNSLHASWQGAPGPHASLRGNFDGTLTRQGNTYAYAGAMSVTEGSGYATGTMRLVIIAADKISMSYQQSNGPRGQNIILACRSVSQPRVPPRPPVDLSNI